MRIAVEPYLIWANNGTSISKIGFSEYRMNVGPPAAVLEVLDNTYMLKDINRTKNSPASPNDFRVHPSTFLGNSFHVKRF